MSDMLKNVDSAAKEFQGVFALRAFPNKRFRVREIYVNDWADVRLLIEVQQSNGNWVTYCKSSVEWLRIERIELENDSPSRVSLYLPADIAKMFITALDDVTYEVTPVLQLIDNYERTADDTVDFYLKGDKTFTTWFLGFAFGFFAGQKNRIPLDDCNDKAEDCGNMTKDEAVAVINKYNDNCDYPVVRKGNGKIHLSIRGGNISLCNGRPSGCGQQRYNPRHAKASQLCEKCFGKKHPLYKALQVLNG